MYYISRAYKIVNGYFKESDGVTSFIYGAAQVFVDWDSVSCPIPLNERTHGAGDRSSPNGPNGQTKLATERFQNRQNYKVLHIEMCDNLNWVQVQSNTVEFVAQLLLLNNVIPTDNYFLRHYDLTGKICPSRFIDINQTITPSWVNFKARIISRWRELKAMQEAINNNTVTSGIPQCLLDGAKYLQEQGYTKDLHNANEPITIGLLGVVLKNYNNR
jgi:N-acetylmuramoyl-L-alanine amidase CwlA